MKRSKSKLRINNQSPSRLSRHALIASVTACLLTVPNFGPMCRYAFFSTVVGGTRSVASVPLSAAATTKRGPPLPAAGYRLPANEISHGVNTP